MKDSPDIPIQQIVSDLCWLHQSTPIMNESVVKYSPEKELSWFQSEAIKPMLVEHFQNKNMKMLGTYFEALWDFYLSHSPGTELVAKNLQVIQEKKTLGEFDFIYQNTIQQKHLHLEVAVKYYLGVPEIDKEQSIQYSSVDCWVGPNINDRLDFKLDKLINYQSQLSKTERGKELLADLGIERVSPEICLLGYLFYPLNEGMKPPLESNVEHNRGYWTTLSNLNLLVESEQYWQVIEKPYWLSPLQVESEEWLSSDLMISQVKEIIDEFNRPVLIGSFSSIKEAFQRKDLYFIVPNDWRRTVIDKM